MANTSIFTDLPTLETERLILRPPRMEDDQAVFAYASDPVVSRHTVWETHRTIDDSRSFLAMMLEFLKHGEPASWAFEEKSTGLMIGTGGFGSWNQQHARAEIGYTLGRSWWNRGYTTEATRAIIGFGFSCLSLNRIEAYCFVENDASARVLLKCGMEYEGLLRERIHSKGAYRDLKVFSILRSEWAR
ncbi:MAG TPA: GNAT family protein [Candidatus Kapabacteria bacterium]|nr:GNAT family protein [Candidatus Kapabacteria bacterium]